MPYFRHSAEMNILKISLYTIGLFVILLFFYKSKTIIRQFVKNYALLIGLAQSDLKTKYAGSYLGMFWAFTQPILTTFIYWFVFQIGFKSSPVEDFPFILWLITGLVPWFFFSEAILSGTGCMTEYGYLVKKVMFQVDILPSVKITASLFVHIVFVLFVFCFYLLYGIRFNVYFLQTIYYSFCLLVLCLGITYITATFNVFIKDTIQVVSVLMQMFFWMTPIVWDFSIMPPVVQTILKMNPLYYIVTGYRDSLINQVWFWEKEEQTLIFWLVAAFLFYMGTKLFRKFKPHFADVL
jgi:O-antigen export system ATP-binding protein rfbA